MVFSPGTWLTIEELKGDCETFAEALADFLESPICPTMLHERLKEAREYYEKKKSKAMQKKQTDGPENMSASQNSQTEYDNSQYTDASSQISLNQEVEFSSSYGKRYC